MALRRHVKNFVKHYSEAEIKVREATSNDPWGPSSSLMLEISDLTYNTISLSEIIHMIWHRMNDHGKNWRHVYKSLTLLDYLLKNGSNRVIQHCQKGFINIQILKDFQHLDDAGKDQGFHVREKAKQVIALLRDEQLLHNEREIARRTRRRTSCAMLFPPKASGKAFVSTMTASDLLSKFPPSEDVQNFPLKASPAAKQSQPAQVSGKTEISQETAELNIVTQKSSEDLITFSEDELSTAAELSTTESTLLTKTSREELTAGGSNPWNASTTLSLSERSPSSLQKQDCSRKSKSSIISRGMLKSPLKKLSSGNTHRVGATLFHAWSSSPEELMATNKQVSTSDVARCSRAASVETIYVSPAFQAFDSLEKSATCTMKSTPAPSKQFYGPSTSSLQNFSISLPNTVQTDDLGGHSSPRPDSTSSMGITSSFSTFSMSPLESTVPNNTPQPPCTSPYGSSYLTSAHGLSSLFFKDFKERIAHSFSPLSVSDADENDSLEILSLLPDGSKCSSKKVNSFQSRTCRASGESSAWMRNILSVPNTSRPPAANLPSAELVCASTEEKGMIILEEIKDAVCGLRGDFCSMTQELHTIGSELTNMMAFLQSANTFLAAPQAAKDAPGQM